MKKLISLILAAVLLLSLASCGSEGNNTVPEDAYEASDIAISTEHFSFTRAEVSYIFFKNYNEFKSNYPDSVDMYNIDTASSLKNQIYHDDYTWFQYFADATVEYMEQVLVFCEGALEKGIELTDEDREDIENTVKTWTDYARDYDYTQKELFRKYFNSDVSADTLRSFLEKETLSGKYQSELVSGFNFTEDDLKGFVEKNKDSFYYTDYLKFAVSEDETSAPKTEADTIAAAKTPEEFMSAVSAYMTDVTKTEVTEEDLDDCRITGEKKKTYGKYSEWAYGGAKENETFIDEDLVNGIYTVYMLTKAPYIDELPAKDIRIIQADISSHNSYQNTVSYLNGLLDDWKAAGATEEAFAELAQKKSDDDGTKDMGGLIYSVSRLDETVTESIREWLYEDGRAVGDTGVVKGEDCYIAVYICGEGVPGWQVSAQIGMGQEKMEECYNEIAEKHPVTTNNDVVASLEA